MRARRAVVQRAGGRAAIEPVERADRRRSRDDPASPGAHAEEALASKREYRRPSSC